MQVLATSLVLLALVGGIVGTTIGLVRAEQARAAYDNRDVTPRPTDSIGCPLTSAAGSGPIWSDRCAAASSPSMGTRVRSGVWGTPRRVADRTGSVDQTAKVWDARSGQELKGDQPL